ncbi:ABC transporter, NodJ (plasmid) [Rhizobium grahamii CCGE 502]|uniref:Nodulation protein J n=2 Tax=Rhizobium grahamii TaxID=1120045 RepID=S3I1Q5_9HYPH|nr:ABC transporter, NodJ [Rhizobium grahamii CCGE 502]
MRHVIAMTLPANAWNWISVWLRNYLAWKRVAVASILGNLADPIIYMFGLGLGLGMMVGDVGGAPYMAFLTGGMVAASAMTSATFETIYAAFARMQTQRWEAILYTQLTLGDLVLGELVWAATKAFLAGTGIMIVAIALGYAPWAALWSVLPVVALTGLAFASLAMVVMALAPSYEYFIFYQTLFLTPMLFLCGAVFPATQLPRVLQYASHLLPLAHAINLIRPAILGGPCFGFGLHLGALCLYALLPFFLAVALLRRRLMP